MCLLSFVSAALVLVFCMTCLLGLIILFKGATLLLMFTSRFMCVGLALHGGRGHGHDIPIFFTFCSVAVVPFATQSSGRGGPLIWHSGVPCVLFRPPALQGLCVQWWLRWDLDLAFWFSIRNHGFQCLRLRWWLIWAMGMTFCLLVCCSPPCSQMTTSRGG